MQLLLILVIVKKLSLLNQFLIKLEKKKNQNQLFAFYGELSALYSEQKF